MADIKLYTWLTPNGIKVSIALEELSLSYETIPIDISTNAQKQPSFLAVNPNGRIPAIVDKSQRVFESGAILLFLVEKYDREGVISYTPGTAEYYEQLSWIMFQMGGLGPMQGKSILKISAHTLKTELIYPRTSKSFLLDGRGILTLWDQEVHG